MLPCDDGQEARAKDNLERTLEPNLDVRSFLETAYLHPAIKAALAEDSTMTLNKGGIHNLVERRNAGSSIKTVKKSTPRSTADRQYEQDSFNLVIDSLSDPRT